MIDAAAVLRLVDPVQQRARTLLASGVLLLYHEDTKTSFLTTGDLTFRREAPIAPADPVTGPIMLQLLSSKTRAPAFEAFSGATNLQMRHNGLTSAGDYAFYRLNAGIERPQFVVRANFCETPDLRAALLSAD